MKHVDSLLLFFAIALLVFIFPIQVIQSRTELQRHIQENYEANYLAWEVQNLKILDPSVLPTGNLSFYCYNENMELQKILTIADELDFSPYRNVIFEYKGKRRGVSLE